MQGQIFIQGANGGMMPFAADKLPEFIPPEPTDEEKKKLVAVWNQPVSFECSCKAVYMSPRTRKWWRCLARYGNWTAKGHIRMRMLKRAAMQEKRFIRTYHVCCDAYGRFWYRRGDGAVVELTIDDETRRLYDGR